MTKTLVKATSATSMNYAARLIAPQLQFSILMELIEVVRPPLHHGFP